MEQLAEIAPMVQILDAPVPQSVVQLVEVLKPCDTMVPEQVIDVPKITSTDVIPHRAVLRVPQKAEQLMDEPVPSFDDFELVQEEEKEAEDEHPQVVPGSRVRDAHGRSWCQVVGPAGCVLVDDRHIHCPVHPPRRGSPPGQGGKQILVIVVALVGDFPCDHAATISSFFEFFVPQVQFLDRMVDIPVLLRMEKCAQWMLRPSFVSSKTWTSFLRPLVLQSFQLCADSAR